MQQNVGQMQLRENDNEINFQYYRKLVMLNDNRESIIESIINSRLSFNIPSF